MFSRSGKSASGLVLLFLMSIFFLGCPTEHYSLTTSVVGGNGILTPATGQQDANTVVILIAAPDSGWRVKAWTGTDDDTSVNSTNQITMTGPKSVSVEFEPIQYTLTTSVVSGNGTLAPATGPQNANTVVPLTATPVPGFRVKAWIGTDDDTGSNNINQVTMSGPKTVTVEFEPAQYLLTTVVVHGHGTLDPLTGLQGNGTTVTLTATPESDYQVKAWNGTDDDSNLSNTNQVTMAAPKAVTVEFEPVGGTAGEEQTVMLPGDVPLVMVWCPPGTFTMGRYPGELDSDGSEAPQHSVTLTHGFWLGKYEVTQTQWKAVMGSNPSNFYGDKRPVEEVSWNYAQVFITALNADTGLTFRLPSESEWEYACRTGEQTPLVRFYWGDDPAYTQADAHSWYFNNASSKTHDVGGKLPNAWGLYDMSGNVWEWVQDWYGNYSSGSVLDPTGPPSDLKRVIRGGCYANYAYFGRSAFRLSFDPWVSSESIGFRIAR